MIAGRTDVLDTAPFQLGVVVPEVGDGGAPCVVAALPHWCWAVNMCRRFRQGNRVNAASYQWCVGFPLARTAEEDWEGLLLLMDPLPTLPRCAGEGVEPIARRSDAFTRLPCRFRGGGTTGVTMKRHHCPHVS
jgi:hypothetical protein